MAVCEAIGSRGHFCLFTTHYEQLPPTIAKLSPRVKNVHFDSRIERNVALTSAVVPSFILQDGPCHNSDGYGIAVAAAAGLPKGIILAAQNRHEWIRNVCDLKVCIADSGFWMCDLANFLVDRIAYVLTSTSALDDTLNELVKLRVASADEGWLRDIL